MEKSQRKVILINKRFQLSILSWFTLLAMLIILVFYGAIWFFFRELTSEAMAAGLPPGHVFFEFLSSQKQLMHKVFVITALIAAGIIYIGGLYLSHKVAGPLYRLNQHLRGSSLSNVRPLKFRKGDYFLEVQDSFNEFIEKK